MSLLPDDASFHEKVQALFVAFRAKGVALSAVDLELVERWSVANVPFEVVARGIRKSAELAVWDATQTNRGLRSLTACQRQVQREIAKYVARHPQAPSGDEGEQAPFHLERHVHLKRALKGLAKREPGLRPGLLNFLSALKPPADFAAANRSEEHALAVLLRLLPPPRRRALLREARDQMERGGATSKAARREALRLHRAALLRHALNLPAFW